MTNTFPHGYALLIGVDENAVSGWELPDVAKDIAALTAVLIHPERCAYSQENLRSISGKEATKDNILAGLVWLNDKLVADKSGNETALIYYSGHGWQDNFLTQPAYYLIPYDVLKSKLRQTALRADDFAAEITALNPQRLLVLLDCCHAGGMGVKDLNQGSLTPFSFPTVWLLGDRKGISFESSTKDIDTALLLRGSGRAVLNSSRSDEKSYIRKDHSMSIFTYHLIEALTGYAPHAPDDKEITAADLLSHVWRKVPQSAQTEHQLSQHPDGQISGNFPIALLSGGEGTSSGKTLPDPLSLLPALKEHSRQSVFDQRGQTVNGPQTNIQGSVNGPVFSGNFQGPIQVETGRQIKAENIKNNGSAINIAGGDVVQKNTASDNSIRGSDITSSAGDEHAKEE